MKVRLFTPGVVKEDDESDIAGVLLDALVVDLLTELPTGEVIDIVKENPLEAAGKRKVILLGVVPRMLGCTTAPADLIVNLN